MIDRFDGEYRFLSNFWPVEIRFEDVTYPSVEHAYQASKTHDVHERLAIQFAKTPGEAKRLGKGVSICRYHSLVKVPIMHLLLERKFEHEDLRIKLLATGSEMLIEGNNWNDTFWGMCNGVGENWLGVLLMRVRSGMDPYFAKGSEGGKSG